jgi:hypothetical protein
MTSMLAVGQLLGCAGLIFEAVIVSWRAGTRFWSSR